MVRFSVRGPVGRERSVVESSPSLGSGEISRHWERRFLVVEGGFCRVCGVEGGGFGWDGARWDGCDEHWDGGGWRVEMGGSRKVGCGRHAGGFN